MEGGLGSSHTVQLGEASLLGPPSPMNPGTLKSLELPLRTVDVDLSCLLSPLQGFRKRRERRAKSIRLLSFLLSMEKIEECIRPHNSIIRLQK